MGFPTWTLIGMGAAVLAALIAVGLALLGQSPTTIRRLSLARARLDMRVRTLTGWGFAFILLAIGFFLAGVPLGPAAEPVTQLPEPTATDTDAGDVTQIPLETIIDGAATPTSQSTVSTGAFGQPADPTFTPTSPVAVNSPTAAGDEADPEETAVGTADPSVTPSRTVAPTATPTASSVPTDTATPTPSPSPTQTPTPTLTPTPITGATATISTNGSTLWVRRTPGGTPLVIVTDGELVILLPGHANQGGIEWQEVQTLAGLQGWVQTEFLQLP